jgi:hypothetical protein
VDKALTAKPTLHHWAVYLIRKRGELIGSEPND